MLTLFGCIALCGWIALARARLGRLRAFAALALVAGWASGFWYARAPFQSFPERTTRFACTVLDGGATQNDFSAFTCAASDGTKLAVATRAAPPHVGTRVLLRGRIEPFDLARNPGEPNQRLIERERGIAGHVSGAQILRRLPVPLTLDVALADAHAWALAQLRARLREPSATILAGELWGERASLPPELRAKFQETGTVHVLVTAGLHLGVVAALVLLLLRGLTAPRAAACAIAIAVIWSYAVFSGFHLPAVRAATMISCALAAYAFGRAIRAWNVFGAAIPHAARAHAVSGRGRPFGARARKPIVRGGGRRAHRRSVSAPRRRADDRRPAVIAPAWRAIEIYLTCRCCRVRDGLFSTIISDEGSNPKGIRIMRRRRSPQPGLVWAYCRVSTLKTEQELSLEEQVRWAEEFARQHGAALRLFKERASAKTVIGRPQCARLLGLLEDDETDLPELVVATSFDRLSRDMTDTMIIARALKRAGVKLYIRDRGEIAMESFGDQAALVGQAMGGHAENEAKSNRCKASWQRRQREGKPMSNKSPYGLQLKAERDVEEPTSGPWVRKAFEWYASGSGAHTIAKRMKLGAPPHRVLTSRRDAEGEPLVRVRAHIWEYNRVLKLLKQQRYRGTLVDPELFDRVQELLRSRPRWRQDRVHEYPLSGAIKCLHCGRSFHGHATGGTGTARLADGSVRTYRRSKRVRYYGCIVCNYMINAEQMEGWFGETIREIEAEPTLIDRWIATSRMTNTQDVAREKNALEMRVRNGSFDSLRQRAWQLALNDDSVAADLPRQLRSINGEEARCRDRLAEIADILDNEKEASRFEEQARTLLRNFKPLYQMATYDQRRELAHAAVQALGGARASKEGLVWLKPIERSSANAC